MKTLEEHLEFIYKTARLKFWFAWNWLQTHPEETLSAVIRDRVGIFRMTGFFDSSRMTADNPDFSDHAWLDLEEKARKIYEKHAADPAARDFEDKAFLLFRQALEQGAEKAFAKSGDFSGFQAGCLRYSAPLEGTKIVAIHIANPLSPRSIFDDPSYLPDCLQKLMDLSEAEFGAKSLHCGTWLNSHPKWLELFPEQWRENMSAPDENIQWHLGFWGQFVNAAGGFHEKNAEKFRTTGRMPFAFRESDCDFAGLRDHMKQ